MAPPPVKEDSFSSFPYLLVLKEGWRKCWLIPVLTMGSVSKFDSAGLVWAATHARHDIHTTLQYIYEYIYVAIVLIMHLYMLSAYVNLHAMIVFLYIFCLYNRYNLTSPYFIILSPRQTSLHYISLDHIIVSPRLTNCVINWQVGWSIRCIGCVNEFVFGWWTG